MPHYFLILPVKVATIFPRGFPGGLCRGSLHEVRVNLPAPLTGRPCRDSLHELRLKIRTPLTGHPCRGSLHELWVKLRAPLTGRKNQRVGHRQNMKKQKNLTKKCWAPPKCWVCGLGVIRPFAPPLNTTMMSSAWVCVAMGTTGRKGRVLAAASPTQSTKQSMTATCKFTFPRPRGETPSAKMNSERG